MAFKSLSQATMVKRGFGQVEPNHLSARFTGEIYAQMPAANIAADRIQSPSLLS